uniref:Uncharacterized protein n=1 Tax=Mirabilis jalapa TaxID=3538 RepID=A0A7T7FPF2_MIRJA|nr:hypothetical protein KYW51_mgp17 [Mirabilis jalapa]QQL93535.1 hypothetical protein [Mirabilis jalapa]
MVRKGNPISVRLGLNRSSDSSRFSEGDRANRILVLLFIFVFILTISYWVCAHYQLDFSRIFRRLLFMIVGSGISVFFRRLGWGLPPLFSSLIISMADPSYASGDAPADLNQPDADGSEEGRDQEDEEFLRRQEEEMHRLRGDLIHRAKTKLERAEEQLDRAHELQLYSSRRVRQKSRRLYRSCILLQKKEARLRRDNFLLRNQIILRSFQRIFGWEEDGPSGR